MISRINPPKYLLLVSPFQTIWYYIEYGYHIIIAKYGSTWPGKVANSARGQLNRENEHFPVSVHACLRLWSREMGSAVPSRVSLLIIHTQA